MPGQMSGADMSGRPLSQSPDAVRKREARQKASSKTSTTSGGRGGAEPSSKGNPLRPSEWSTLGEPLSPHEAERQLYWAHVGLGKVIRSDLVMSELKEEFEVAGENYAFVANKMWPPLRIMIRFVAPVVLVAVLLVIWGTMIAHTPWMSRLRQWWENRGRQEQAEQPVYETPPFEVVQPAAPSNGSEPQPPQASPPLPRRPAVVRRFQR